MKKSIICGIASLAMAAAPVFSAFAEAPQAGTADGYFMGSKDATVGEVDETIYSVDLYWGDMTFDWKYAKDINKLGFEPSRSCMGETYQHGDYITNKEFDGGILYADATCTTVLEEEPADDTIVYSKSEFENHLSVTDNSVNGKVKVSLSHMDISRENYLVLGEDIYYYYGESYADGILTENPGFPGTFYANLVLRTDSETDLSGIDIESEDKIGTITLNIEPDLN